MFDDVNRSDAKGSYSVACGEERMINQLKDILSAKEIQPDRSARPVPDPVFPKKDMSGADRRFLEGIGGTHRAGIQLKDSHPTVLVKVIQLPSGKEITTFVNPTLSKTSEALYVMWLNREVTVKGNVVDRYF